MTQIISVLLETLVKIVIELVKLIFGFATRGSQSLFNKRDRPMDARFAKPSRVLSRRGGGFCLDGTHQLSVQDSFKNSLVIGGSGTGKSATILYPSLLTMDQCSFIVHDPSGELAKTAGSLHARGFDVKILNYADVHLSEGYNPLHRITTLSDAGQVAHGLVNAGLGKSSVDSFWNNAAESIITTLIGILLSQANQYRNLANVARLLNLLGSDPTKVDALFSRFATPKLFEEYKSFLAMGEKLSSNVLATAKTALKLFSNDSVALCTSHDTLNFENLRKKKTALFIQNSVMSTEFYAPLSGLLVTQIFESLLGPLPGKNDLPVFFLCDEASSFKANWSLILANCRKWRVGCLLALQERLQLEELYSVFGAQSIESNCFSRLYFTNPSLKTARDLSELLGKYEYEDEKGVRKIRQLMSPQELKQMPLDTALLLAGHHPPMLCTMQPYYKTSLRKMVNLPAPPRESKLPWASVPMLPL
jgi:type IV secretion system protein VirD4